MNKKLTIMAMFFVGSLFVVSVAMADQKTFIDLCKTGTAEEVRLALNDKNNSPSKAYGGVTPLMSAAAARGDTASAEKIKLLLDAGAKINVTDKNGMTALMYAARFSDKPEVILALANAGAKRDLKDRKGWNALSHAAAKNPSTSITETLIDLGAYVNSAEKEGVSPLMLAFRGGAPKEVIDTLLEAGADPKQHDKAKRTAADYVKRHASLKDNDEVIQSLSQPGSVKSSEPARFVRASRFAKSERIRAMLDAGTDPNAKVDGLSPLMLAARDNADPKVIDTLVAANAKINDQDPDGRTALMYAAGNPEAFKSLISAGARADIVDNNGKTALDYASEAGVVPPNVLRPIKVADDCRREALERHKAEILSIKSENENRLADEYNLRAEKEKLLQEEIAKNKELLNQLEAEKASNETIMVENGDLKAQLDASKSAAEAASAENADLKVQLEESKSAAEAASAEIADLKAQLEASKSTAEAVSAENADLKAKLETAKSEK